MDLEVRDITIHRIDRSYKLLLIERDDIPEVSNLEYGNFVINTEDLDSDSLLSRLRDIFISLGDNEDTASVEANLLLKFCLTGKVNY